MLGIIKNFSATESSSRGDAAAFHMNAEIGNLSSSRTYEFLTVLLYAARYPEDGGGRLWTQTQFIRYLGPGDRRQVTAVTDPIANGERIVVAVEVYWNRNPDGEPDDRAETVDVYVGGVVPAPVAEPVVLEPPVPQPAAASGRTWPKVIVIAAIAVVVAGSAVWLLHSAGMF